MAKAHRPHTAPEDVLTGRVQVGVRDLVALIRRVNPTGLALPAAETARRYALKARLQSLLVRRAPDELEIRIEPGAPGVVLLVHRPSGAEACHAPLDALDEDARAWVQRRLDVGEMGETGAPSAPPPPAAPRFDAVEAPALPIDSERAPASKLLRAGRASLADYDYERAGRYLERALARSNGRGQVAAALLELLVDYLAADEDALAVGARLSPEATRRADVRLLLAVAAARRGDRAAALRWLEALPGPRAAEALATLARASIAAGDIDAAAQDLAAAEQRAPAHPALRAISEAIAARRAAEREPLEAARRALDLAEAAQQRAAAGRAIEEAEQALAADRAASALGLLRRALAGVGAEEAARIQARITAIEAEERARADAAEVARVVSLLEMDGPDPPAGGLLAYAALEERRRKAVRARMDLPHLDWLDEMGARGEGPRARAAIQAALALGRAEALVYEAPEAALALLAAERPLQGVRRARKLQEEAARCIQARRREEARAALDEARVAEETANSLRARALLEGVATRDLSDDARQEAEALRARLARRKERRRRAAQIEELRRRGDALPARRAVDELLAGAADDEERARWAALRAEIQAEVQAAFRVQILEPDAAMARCDIQLVAGWRRCAPCPGGETFLAVHSQERWVFLQLFDRATRAHRACVVLRTPHPLDAYQPEITADRVIVGGWSGYVLEIALGSWEVLRWFSLVPQPGPEGAPLRVPACPAPEPAPVAISLGAPERDEPPPVQYVHRIVDACFIPGTSLFWIVHERESVTVFDSAAERPARELSIGSTQIRRLPGPREPVVAVLRKEGAALALYSGRGAPLGPERRLPARAMRHALAPAPGREALFVMARETRGAADDAAEVGWLEVPLDARTAVGPLHRLEGAAGAGAVAAATDASTGLTFVLLDLPGDRRELLAFARAAERDPLALRWRKRVPARTVLVQEGDHGPVALLAARGDRLDEATLGPSPPDVPEDEPDAPAAVPREALLTYYRRCVTPSGDPAAVVASMLRTFRGKSQGAIKATIARCKEKLDADSLAGLSIACMVRVTVEDGAELADWAWQRHPDHAALSVLQGIALVHARQWRRARALLSRVDHRALDPQTARHLHHLWATALLHLGEREEARFVLALAETFEGDCQLDWLIALAAPPGEERAWTPVQEAVRDFAQAIADADACLARRDASGALRALDRHVVWASYEVQSLARVAEAHLLVDGDGPLGRMRKALALATFEDAQAERRFAVRRELPLPSGKWPPARLEALRQRARAWLDETLGEPPRPGAGAG